MGRLKVPPSAGPAYLKRRPDEKVVSEPHQHEAQETTSDPPQSAEPPFAVLKRLRSSRGPPLGTFQEPFDSLVPRSLDKVKTSSAENPTQLDSLTVKSNDTVLGKRSREDAPVQSPILQRPPPESTECGQPRITQPAPSVAIEPQPRAANVPTPAVNREVKDYLLGSAGPFFDVNSSKIPIPDTSSCVEICELHPLSIRPEILKDFLRHGWTATDIFEHLPQEIQDGLFEHYDGRKNSVISSRMSTLKARLRDRGEWDEWMSSEPRRPDGRVVKTASVPTIASTSQPLRPTKVSLELEPDQRLSFNAGSAVDIEYRSDLVSIVSKKTMQGMPESSAETELKEPLPATMTLAPLPAPIAQLPVVNPPISAPPRGLSGPNAANTDSDVRPAGAALWAQLRSNRLQADTRRRETNRRIEEARQQEALQQQEASRRLEAALAEASAQPLSDELEDLEEVIRMNTVLLASLEAQDHSDADASRRVIRRTLESLHRRHTALSAQPGSAVNTYDDHRSSAQPAFSAATARVAATEVDDADLWVFERKDDKDGKPDVLVPLRG